MRAAQALVGILLVAGSILLVTGAGMLQATLSALVTLLARADQRGARPGIRDASSAFGRILGPIAGGVALERAGAEWPAMIASLAALGGVMLALAIGDRLRAFERGDGRSRTP